MSKHLMMNKELMITLFQLFDTLVTKKRELLKQNQ